MSTTSKIALEILNLVIFYTCQFIETTMPQPVFSIYMSDIRNLCVNNDYIYCKVKGDLILYTIEYVPILTWVERACLACPIDENELVVIY